MKLKRLLLIILLLIIVAGGGAFAFISSKLPLNNYPENTTFEIPEGSYQKEVFSLLEKEGIIKNADISFYYSRLMKNADFKAGKFNLPSGLDLDGLIDYLSDGTNIQHDTVSVTLFEDDDLELMAKRISEKTNVTYDELMNYWNNENNIKSFIDKYEVLTDEILKEDIRYPLEGYLAPNTYEFFAKTSPEEITEKLLKERENFYQEYKNDFDKSQYSIHEIFTLASIVQYESSDQMELVAGVFYNRLQWNMALQSTVTACYGAHLNKEECALVGDLYITTDDINPYNTYQNPGLPVGPILCPGKDALLATLKPTDSEYFYFIGAKCGDQVGKTVFAETLDEHNENIREYISSCN